MIYFKYLCLFVFTYSSLLAQQKIHNFWVLEGYFKNNTINLAQKHISPIQSISLSEVNSFIISLKNCDEIKGSVLVLKNKIKFYDFKIPKNCIDNKEIKKFLHKLSKVNTYQTFEQPLLILMNKKRKLLQFENYR